MFRETTSRCSEKPHRPQDPSGNHQFGVEIRDVFEKVPGAQRFSRFFARQTVEIRDVLSSAT